MIYRHYKGGRYRVIATGLMESNLDPMVVYQHADGGQIWIRPAKDFYGTVNPLSGERTMETYRFTAEDKTA